MQPLGHIRVFRRPRIDLFFLSAPDVLITVKELRTMALELAHRIAVETVLIPVVVLFAVALPLVRGVDGIHRSVLKSSNAA